MRYLVVGQRVYDKSTAQAGHGTVRVVYPRPDRPPQYMVEFDDIDGITPREERDLEPLWALGPDHLVTMTEEAVTDLPFMRAWEKVEDGDLRFALDAEDGPTP